MARGGHKQAQEKLGRPQVRSTLWVLRGCAGKSRGQATARRAGKSPSGNVGLAWVVRAGLLAG